MDCDPWNILSGGYVTTIAGAVPGNVRVSVEIMRLCDHLPTEREHLVVA